MGYFTWEGTHDKLEFVSTKEGAIEDRPSSVADNRDPAYFITEVLALDNFRLQVKFIDGTVGEVQMREWIFSPDAGVFADLSDTHLFSQVYIENDTVTWPGELDLAPDALYDDIRSAGSGVLILRD